PLGFEPTDRDGFVSGWMHGLVATVPDVVTRVVKSYSRGPVVLARIVSAGTTTDGNAYEWDSVCLSHGGVGGVHGRVEFFTPDQWSDALALFDDWSTAEGLRAAEIEPGLLENAVTHAAELVMVSLTSRDEAAVAELISPEYRYVDHRFAGITPEARGLDAFLEQMQGYGAVGFREVGREVVAVRGERLALSEQTLESAEGFVTVVLRLGEVDASGCFVQTDVYDEAELTAALGELDERHLAGEGAEYEFLVRRLGDFARAFFLEEAARAALYAPDATVRNHRKFGWAMNTVADLLEREAGNVGVAELTRAIIATMECRDNASLIQLDQTLVTPEGNEYSNSILAVDHWVGGRVDRVEIFDPEDADAARARFEEIAAEGPTPAIDNRCVRVLERSGWLAAFTGATGPDSFAPGCVLVDGRAGVNAGEITGGAEVGASIFAAPDGFGSYTLDPIAVRGERMALFRWTYCGEQGFEAPGLRVIELDDADRIARVTSFDETDLVGALEALEEQHVATAGDLAPAQVTPLAAYRALNRRDWPVFSVCFDDELAIIDHRRLGFPPGRGGAALTGELQSLVEQVPDVVAYVTKIRTKDHVAIATTHQRGTAALGGEATWDFHAVATVDPDARIIRHEYFDADCWADALARFEELAHDGGFAEGWRSPALVNRAVRTQAEAFAALMAGDTSERAAALTAPDLQAFDRRRGVAAPDLVGRDARRANLAAVMEFFGAIDYEVVAIRGERLALLHWTIGDTSDFATSGYDVTEVDAAGATSRIVTFDDDDLAAALEELDTRHVELLGDAATDIDRTITEGSIVINRREPEVYERFMTPDVEIVDHLRLNFPPANRASDFTRMLRRLYELAPDTLFVRKKVIVSRRALLTVDEQRSTTPEGNRYNWVRNTVSRLAFDGRLERSEFFPEDRWNDALALFDDWAGDSDVAAPGAVLTPATLLTPISAAFAARDWDWIRGRTAPGIELQDRRSTVSSHTATGADAVVELFQGFADVGFETLENILVESRNDRLVLIRRIYRTGAGFEIEMLAVIETDEQGLATALVLFDADDMDAAIAEIEARDR
ncbi:MAG: hypothetical protein ABJC79_17705, partial [Acidimicrobiia bacterium]